MTHVRLRRLSVATLLALVVGGMTLLAAPADAAGLYLHRGSRGTAVKTLETRLVKVAGLPRGAVDRRYRLTTVRAVKRFQRAQHVRVTGIVNQRTWDLVANAYRVATAPPPPPPAWTAPWWAPPKVTAHRGGSDEAPENTLQSIQHGVDVGADVVEFDVRSTSDGVLVLMHDPTLQRTTTCAGEVRQTSWEQLQRCTTKLGAQPVPRLDDVLDYLKTKDTPLSPEIKDYGTNMSDADVATLVTALQTRDLVARTFVQSFNPDVFPKLTALEPSLKKVYLSNSVVLVSRLQQVGADIASVPMFNSRGEVVLGVSNVQTYHRYGYQIFTWTADTTAELQRAWDLGVDSVGTDIPTRAIALYR